MTKNREIIHRQYDDNWIVSITCDICKETYRGQNWGKGGYVEENTDVSFEYGYCFPEGRSTKKIEFDVCPKCFKEKIIPFMQTFGAESIEEIESEC